ncbi:MAG: alpha/beta hydrolase [Chloroflexi bacterium]|nr:alpha/beta hydrolase [Chloroflexota bacterium]
MRQVVLAAVLAAAAAVIAAWRRLRPPSEPTPAGPAAKGAGFIKVDGAAYHARTTGDGPSVVFLHGFLSTAGVWDPVIDRLGQDFRCVAVDLPGFGRSAKGTTVPAGVWGRAEWLRDLLDALCLDAVTLVGASMGGQTALAFASRYPARVRNLVLVAPFAREPDPYPARDAWTWPMVVWLFERSMFSRRWLAWRQRQQMTRPHRLPRGRVDDLYRQTQTPGFLDGIRDGYIQPPVDDLREQLADVQAPVLVLWGAGDRTLSVALGREVAARVPNGRLRVIAGAGHSVQLDEPDAVAGAIRTAMNDGEEARPA